MQRMRGASWHCNVFARVRCSVLSCLPPTGHHDLCAQGQGLQSSQLPSREHLLAADLIFSDRASGSLALLTNSCQSFPSLVVGSGVEEPTPTPTYCLEQGPSFLGSELHCTWLRGAASKQVFFLLQPDKKQAGPRQLHGPFALHKKATQPSFLLRPKPCSQWSGYVGVFWMQYNPAATQA